MDLSAIFLMDLTFRNETKIVFVFLSQYCWRYVYIRLTNMKNKYFVAYICDDVFVFYLFMCAFCSF